MRRSLFQELKMLYPRFTFFQMAAEMGYRSPNTVKAWFDNKRIPPPAVAKVEAFLAKHKEKTIEQTQAS